MTKQELKEKLIGIRNGGFITPVLEEIMTELDNARAQQRKEDAEKVRNCAMENPPNEVETRLRDILYNVAKAIDPPNQQEV